MVFGLNRMCICWNSLFLSLLDSGWYYSCPAPSTSHQGCLKQKKPTEEFCHSLFFFPSLVVPHLFFKISFFCLWCQGFFKHCGRKRGPCVYSPLPMFTSNTGQESWNCCQRRKPFLWFPCTRKGKFCLALKRHSSLEPTFIATLPAFSSPSTAPEHPMCHFPPRLVMEQWVSTCSSWRKHWKAMSQPLGRLGFLTAPFSSTISLYSLQVLELLSDFVLSPRTGKGFV